MALKALVCPQCNGQIELDQDREFGFCPFCGCKIMLHEVVEVKHSGAVEINNVNELLKKGKAFLALEEWEKAEKIFDKMIDEYPYESQGYYYKICAISQNFNSKCLDTDLVCCSQMYNKMKKFCDENNAELVKLYEFINELYKAKKQKMEEDKENAKRKQELASHNYYVKVYNKYKNKNIVLYSINSKEIYPLSIIGSILIFILGICFNLADITIIGLIFVIMFICLLGFDIKSNYESFEHAKKELESDGFGFNEW